MQFIGESIHGFNIIFIGPRDSLKVNGIQVSFQRLYLNTSFQQTQLTNELMVLRIKRLKWMILYNKDNNSVEIYTPDKNKENCNLGLYLHLLLCLLLLPLPPPLPSSLSIPISVFFFYHPPPSPLPFLVFLPFFLLPSSS